MCVQVMHVWQRQAALQSHHRALLVRCTRQVQETTLARVLRTWHATARHLAEAAAKAQECHARLFSRCLKCALCFWRTQAMAKRMVRGILKVCIIVHMVMTCGVL